jgi:hypothetical protein
MKQVNNTKGVISKMQEKHDQSVAEANAEAIYWATGRTKIYPEKDFAKNYIDIQTTSEKKRERKNMFPRFVSLLNDI